MKNMGWNEGEGLGKDGDGQKTHIQIKRRPENMGFILVVSLWVGLGSMENDASKQTYISTSGDFSDVLKGLNSEHSGILFNMCEQNRADKEDEEEGKEGQKEEGKEG